MIEQNQAGQYREMEAENARRRISVDKAADPWRHRSAAMLCKTCIWYLPKESIGMLQGAQTQIGRCRRHAPTMGGYPVVYMTDWCGDHRLDENKL